MEFTRESIFISAIRKFLNTLGVIVGIAVGIFLISLGISAISNTVQLPDKGDLTVSADADWNRKLLPATTPVILRIDISGVIGLGELKEKKFKNMLLDSREGALANDRVKAILLYINTPGGTVTDSAGIYEALKSYKEKFQVPVFAYVEGLCASGGMFIASAADQIFATQDSIIGSVGVRWGPVFNYTGTMEKVGIEAVTITKGKDKDALNPFRPWEEDEGASIKAITAASYENFVNVVTDARKQLNKDKLINDYGANVFIASKSQELGYIDHADANYNDALKELVQAAGIKEGEKYQVLEIEPSHSLLKGLTNEKLGLLSGKIQHVFPLGPNMTTELSGKPLFLYQP